MASKIVNVRLNDEEQAMLQAILSSRDNFDRNPSEMVRLLIHREYLRRSEGRSKVSESEISTEMRLGRPRAARAD